jgi:hypothetical protein
MPEFVVRGGVASAVTLQNGYGEHDDVAGLYGFSVQYRPGRSILQLANAGQFPHPKISYTVDESLTQTAQLLGYDVAFVKSPRGRYHHTLMASVSATGETIRVLPDDLAAALSSCFQQMHNPFQRL